MSGNVLPFLHAKERICDKVVQVCSDTFHMARRFAMDVERNNDLHSGILSPFGNDVRQGRLRLSALLQGANPAKNQRRNLQCQRHEPKYLIKQRLDVFCCFPSLWNADVFFAFDAALTDSMLLKTDVSGVRHELSMCDSWMYAISSRSQIPALRQRLNSLCLLLQSPYPGCKLRQSGPARTIQKTVLTYFLLSLAIPLQLSSLPERNSSILLRILSIRSWRGTPRCPCLALCLTIRGFQENLLVAYARDCQLAEAFLPAPFLSVAFRLARGGENGTTSAFMPWGVSSHKAALQNKQMEHGTSGKFRGHSPGKQDKKNGGEGGI